MKKSNFIQLSISLCMFILYSCGEPNGFYIDIKKQAIVSCTGHGFKHLEIESDSSAITLQGTSSIVYLNTINKDACTKMNDSIVCNYLLKLQPSKSYRIISRIDGDQGAMIQTFTTNKIGRIILASDSICR